MDTLPKVLGNILAVTIVFGPWVMIPSWVVTRDAMGTIAKNCAIRWPWLTWIPCVNIWVQGSISDQYRRIVKNQKKSGRKTLLVLRVQQLILWAAFSWCAARGLRDAAIVLEKGAPENVADRMLVYGVMDGLWFFFPALILGLMSFVRKQMALYDIYAAFAPKRKTLYLVLSIFPVVKLIAKPLCLRDCRDGEMLPEQEFL